MPDDPRPPFDEPSAEELPALVEALLFVADGPSAEPALARALGVPPRQLRDALDAIGERLDGRGIRLLRGPEGVQLVTAPEAAAAVEHFLGLESGRRLSTAALETLAVIAYRQPATRSAIEAIRGTSSDAVLATLRARGLIERVGRAEGPGRPALYGTTQRFLEHFGLEQAGDLPGLEQLAERLGLDAERAGFEGAVQEPLPLGGVRAPLGERVYSRRAARVRQAGRAAEGGERRPRRSNGPASAAPALPAGAAALPEAASASPPLQPRLSL
jgi:segregation and condensation protein B